MTTPKFVMVIIITLSVDLFWFSKDQVMQGHKAMQILAGYCFAHFLGTIVGKCKVWLITQYDEPLFLRFHCGNILNMTISLMTLLLIKQKGASQC